MTRANSTDCWYGTRQSAVPCWIRMGAIAPLTYVMGSEAATRSGTSVIVAPR